MEFHANMNKYKVPHKRYYMCSTSLLCIKWQMREKISEIKYSTELH
jgi:hypothetical protein